MASVLLDLDDVAYIDEVTEEDIAAAGDNKTDNKQRRNKNLVIGDKLTIDTNQTLVNELRNDRKEKRLVSNTQQIQTEKDFKNLIHSIEQESFLRELRAERARSLKERETCHTNKSEINEHSSELPTDKNDQMAKDLLTNTDRKRSLENLNGISDKSEDFHLKDANGHQEVEDSERGQKVFKPNTSELEKENDRGKNEDSDLLVNNGQDTADKSPMKQKTCISRHKVKPLPLQTKCYETTNIRMKIQEEEQRDDIENEEPSEYQYQVDKLAQTDETNGAKPKQNSKLLASTADGTDVIEPSENAQLETAQDVPDAPYYRLISDDTTPEESHNIYTSKKGKRPKKKGKKKGSKEASKNNTKAESSDIRITVTDEEGVEKDADLSLTPNSYRSKGGLSQTASTSPTYDTTSGISEVTSLNFLRRLSEDGDKQVNSLILQQQLYKEQKAKPFQKLSKTKTGLFEVGIEGDSKRSLVKSIVVIPDKRVILYDRNNKCLKLFDSEFNPLDRLSIGVKFCCLSLVYPQTVAATLPDEKCLQLFHLQDGTNKIQPERKFSVEAELYAVSHFNNQLFMLQRNRKPNLTDMDEWEITRMDLTGGEGKLVSLRTFCPGHKDCMLWANDQGLYMTNRLENEIHLFGHEGNFMHRYKVEFSLPGGITVDGVGNLYVCGGSMTSFIEVIKPDLTKAKVIFNKTSCDLVAICYDKDSNNLYVCDKINAKTIRYKINHNGTVQGLMKSLLLGSGQDV